MIPARVHASLRRAPAVRCQDFNWNSLHNSIEPLVIVRAGGEGGYIQVRVNGDLPGTLEFIRSVWTKYDTTHPYEYYFLDQELDKQYRADEVQHKLFSWLSYVCIFVSLLGLLGLSAFNASQRTKEIGIRKVHGAAVPLLRPQTWQTQFTRDRARHERPIPYSYFKDSIGFARQGSKRCTIKILAIFSLQGALFWEKGQKREMASIFTGAYSEVLAAIVESFICKGSVI